MPQDIIVKDIKVLLTTCDSLIRLLLITLFFYLIRPTKVPRKNKNSPKEIIYIVFSEIG